MANRIDDNRLLPCPFCGEPAAIWYFPQHDRPILKEAYYVGCTNDNCGCEMEHPGGYKSLDDAVSAWNMRAKEPTTKNDLGVDCISRTRTIERLKLNFPISQGADNSRDRHRYMQALADIQAIREMPSVTPQEPTIKALGEELRKARKGIADEKVLIGYNLAVAICNKHLGESEG